jgi:plasmid stability protein
MLMLDYNKEKTMPTLYVENVSKDLYESLRKRAKRNHRSLAAEVRALLEESVPSERELKRRHDFVERLDRFRASVSRVEGNFPTAEEMVREDRER